MPRRVSRSDQLRQMEERAAFDKQAPDAARKGKDVPDDDSSRRARSETAHMDLVLAVAVEMGELSVTLDPQTGGWYYARTEKDSPLFGPGNGSVRVCQLGCPAEGVHGGTTHRRWWIFRLPFNLRMIVLFLLGLPLVGALWVGPRAAEPAASAPATRHPGALLLP